MKTTTLLIAATAVSLVAGTGFAFANDADDQASDDQIQQDEASTPNQSMSDQGYSERWFSSTGYGPNDEQAEQTRALNRQQIEQAGEVNARDQDDQDDSIQGPSDAAAPDADDEDDDAATDDN
jgi:hypothetical protein